MLSAHNITSSGKLSKRSLLSFALALLFCSVCAHTSLAAPRWSAKLDGKVRFYQTTELGVLVVGTEKSLYSVDAETGEVLWRRKDTRVDETDVAAVPGTDILLLSLERGDKTRLEAVDLMTGDAVWRSDKVKGGVMQMTFDPDSNLVAVVLVRDAKGRARSGFKRRPEVHVFNLATGRELWRRELEGEVEMMPALWSEDEDKDVPYTLDNYHPPAFMDGRLYLFYEGLTSLDAQTGSERRREKFRVNEEGLALTEADAVADEGHVYVSGRGRVRAISRVSGEEKWEAKDLGLTPQMMMGRDRLFVRTGGRFARLEDGEVEERGPYGISAIDSTNGKVLWRYKGADKGITNMVVPEAQTIIVADRDDLIFIDAETGKRRMKVSHGIERAAFVLLNERGEAVVGGQNEVAAFMLADGRESWRERHTAPGRGILRTVAAIAARAASLYFRYGGAAMTAYRGVRLATSLASIRWSGLVAHATSPNLTALAANYSREYVRDRLSAYGTLSRLRSVSTSQAQAPRFNLPRPNVSDVEERLLDKLDPAAQLEKLSRFLWHRRRLAALRGQWLYFYTDLKGAGRGLAGVNINTGRTERRIPLSDPDERFISDETMSLLYTVKDNRLVAHSLSGGE
ncbi:MAG TPA: PQQ-binding-like beta-propeller repeat protein [Pyrinomonadaceae bacterium]|nr:PQQ-binding-like beta-propeller repeat protein [Pyrinomonadaceae bacterium]